MCHALVLGDSYDLAYKLYIYCYTSVPVPGRKYRPRMATQSNNKNNMEVLNFEPRIVGVLFFILLA